MDKLKLLHIFDNYLPQTENWAYNLITSLPNCEIHIGAKNYLKQNFYNRDFQFVDNYFDEFDKMNRQLGKRSFLDLLKKLAIKLIPFVFGKVDNIFLNYAKNNNIQIVHCHFANIGWEFRKVAKQLNIPLVISFYGWDYEKLPFTKPVYQERFTKLFKIADAFICEGNHGAAMLKRQGCPEAKIFVVPLGVQFTEIPIFKREKKLNQLELVQIASFTEKKGQRYAIEAISKIIKKCPNIKLTFIGNDRDVKLRNQLKELVETLDLKKHVVFESSIDYKDLYTTLERFDVFIHPSCYAVDKDCEGGAPIVLLDAQATGMPVISTTHCDIPDEVIHGKTGLLSPEKSVDDLVDSIEAFYKMDNETYQQFSENARTHVEEKYNVVKHSKQLKRIYNKINLLK